MVNNKISPMKRILLTLLLALTAAAHAEYVCSVHDGDTFRVIAPGFKDCNTGHTQSIRMWGVDAPEIKQEKGPASRDYLKSLIWHKEIQLKCAGKSFNRRVCTPYVNTEPSSSVERMMILSGMAYDSVKYSKGAYQTEEAIARAKRVGVWSLPNGGVRPWVWRHGHKL